MNFGTITAYDDITGYGQLRLEGSDASPMVFLNDPKKVALSIGQQVSFDFITIAINLWPTDGTEPRIMVGSDGKRVK